jgi:transmembrane sensor
MEEEKFWNLLSVKLTGEATREELEAFDQLLQKNPELGLQAQMLQQMWKKDSHAENKTDDFFNRHLQRLSNHPDIYPVQSEIVVTDNNPTEEILIQRKRYRWLYPLTGVAASVGIIVFLLYNNGSFSKIKKEEHLAQNTVTTRKGSKSNVQLPDGTMAWLNADSKLTYDENFRGEFREVTLEGEAYFDVVKDKTRPFIIHTKTIDIKVLGTAFNVRAYETEKNTETSLFRGSVEVTLHNSPEKKIILKPNEKLMVNNKSLSFTRRKDIGKNHTPVTADITVGKVHFEAKDSSAWETLWIKNKLVFDEESLEEVALKIERWYDVKVIINGDEALKSTAYTGIFENENLFQVMEALKITGNFKYTINKDIITIR